MPVQAPPVSPPLAISPFTPPPDVLEALLDATAARHHHLCPRQILGVRLGWLGVRLLGLDGNGVPYANSAKRLFTFVETDGCGADGISTVTNCWVGRRTLRVMDYGKMAATLVDRETGRAVRVAPHPAGRQRVGQYVDLDSAESRWHGYMAAYRIMPDSALLVARDVTLTLSLDAIISRPGLRVTCAACGEEIMNAREQTVAGRILCRSCAGDGYYAL